MYFATAGGWTGPTPPAFAAWPIMAMLNHGESIPQADQQFRAFLAAQQVTAVVIDQRDPLGARWLALLDPRTTRITQIGGVIVARPSLESLAPYRDARPKKCTAGWTPSASRRRETDKTVSCSTPK
jgi:hypothetical protein